MIKINSYLNFDGNAEEVFKFYQSVFGGDLMIMRMSEAPGMEGISEEEKGRVMHVSLPISKDCTLMASDILPSFGHKLAFGNNVHISVHPDSRAEAERIFNALSTGGNIDMPLADQFWGDYFGSFTDKFGVGWMINHSDAS